MLRTRFPPPPTFAPPPVPEVERCECGLQMLNVEGLSGCIECDMVIEATKSEDTSTEMSADKSTDASSEGEHKPLIDKPDNVPLEPTSSKHPVCGSSMQNLGDNQVKITLLLKRSKPMTTSASLDFN